METRRLRMLLELARLGSMREVAEVLHTTTSTVSQQISVLAGEMGAALIEPDGRRVRLTPAGRRLADHAITILEAVEDARADLAPQSDPRGTVRVAGFSTAFRRSVMPALAPLAAAHPNVTVRIVEHEPTEAIALLLADRVDVALVYDYDLAPATIDAAIDGATLWSTRWGLAVPDADYAVADDADAAAVMAVFRRADWIVNSRNDADERVLRTLASIAGFEPVIGHAAESLELVESLVVAGLGVGLLPMDRPRAVGIRVLPLSRPGVSLRCRVIWRRDRPRWPPLAAVIAALIADRPAARVTVAAVQP
ncbi:LysR family transcriptional regulator [Millisia brevis]|uniref:LysR family transcriptional regulator n=1 Tax=Millisia brevis TaxID=264148 RepID=UPI000831D6BB|nr:LysR family transcriptional regulator [Millisia brevis]